MTPVPRTLRDLRLATPPRYTAAALLCRPSLQGRARGRGRAIAPLRVLCLCSPSGRDSKHKRHKRAAVEQTAESLGSWVDLRDLFGAARDSCGLAFSPYWVGLASSISAFSGKNGQFEEVKRGWLKAAEGSQPYRRIARLMCIYVDKGRCLQVPSGPHKHCLLATF